MGGRIRLPVVVDNDANAAAQGESRFGAGKGQRFVLCVNLGTGIGGALVLDGRVFRGANGMAGEFGHMQVVEDGHRCPCGNRGCWEQYASGNALEREARELVVARSPMAHRLAALCGGDPALLPGPLVTEAARDGDPLAVELLADMGRWLGVGLANLVAAFDPSCVIIGGGVSEAGDLLLAPDPGRAWPARSSVAAIDPCRRCWPRSWVRRRASSAPRTWRARPRDARGAPTGGGTAGPASATRAGSAVRSRVPEPTPGGLRSARRRRRGRADRGASARPGRRSRR